MLATKNLYSDVIAIFIIWIGDVLELNSSEHWRYCQIYLRQLECTLVMPYMKKDC